MGKGKRRIVINSKNLLTVRFLSYNLYVYVKVAPYHGFPCSLPAPVSARVGILLLATYIVTHISLFLQIHLNDNIQKNQCVF